ncbi:hypothetical protein GCM10027079_18890 [Sediminivirga luteola]|uniref:Helix-turn-helix domain-containing protein n=1 Tax=Sediminivirga luteola TaxID=1774748 RepID=A0A8J2TW01_9MICO|nr:hypothetical protein GCM10011333_06360 [Sediminivirga luteola]
MVGRLDLLGVSDAAEMLGVTRRQVNRLTASGDLVKVARGLVDRTSVERYLASGGAAHVRGWTEPTAWAAITLLAGGEPYWLGAPQRSRLRHALHTVSSPSEFTARVRNRATVHPYEGHRSVTERVRQELVIAHRSRLGLVETGTYVDGYAGADALPVLARRFGLRENPRGTIILRAVTIDLSIVADLTSTSALAAVDTAGSLDPRERGVGERALSQLLERFRR